MGIEIQGKVIQYDNSGVGYNFRNASEDNLPANIREEIAAEIIDGGKAECDDYVASNGQHYRWSNPPKKYTLMAYGLPQTISTSSDRAKAVANATRKARKAMRDMKASGPLPWIVEK
jgi:hypothetical protein